MLWFDKLVKKINSNDLQIINDSKTPSGRVHVGALRGVIIHDAVYRMLKDRGIPVLYKFGVDDYDPLDELPYGQDEFFEKYLGAPLCNVPPPMGSNASDMAEHYISEFFDIFRELGVGAETYRMRDIYRAGQFDEVIDIILENAATVRHVYKEVSNSERPNNWYPFQVVCESCGRIGTTEVIAYENKKVTYRCRKDLVKWAKGCEYTGEVSPFNGNGKLPWKLEWVAKWRTFPVTIEGAGKDHTTKGGSRDVAAECLRRIFNQQPPQNIPYEFFLVGGAKMSSSKGIGASAREIANFLPPDVLRFLILRPQPNRPVNFTLNEEFITKLFNDFDRLHTRVFNDPKISSDDKQVYLLSEVEPEGDYYEANFQNVMTLLQMPHLDLQKEIEKRKGSHLTEIDLKHLTQRIKAVQYWLNNYTSEEERLYLRDRLPERSQELNSIQKAFLNNLAENLIFVDWHEDTLQTTIFDTARLTPIDTGVAFQAIYRVLFDRDSGPKAGNLLAFLDKKFVINRFKELTFSKVDFWRTTSLSIEAFEAWLDKNIEKVRGAEAYLELFAVEVNTLPKRLNERLMEGLGTIEIQIVLDDSKIYMKRITFSHFRGINHDFQKEAVDFIFYVSEYLENLKNSRSIQFPIKRSKTSCESLSDIIVDNMFSS